MGAIPTLGTKDYIMQEFNTFSDAIDYYKKLGYQVGESRNPAPDEISAIMAFHKSYTKRVVIYNRKDRITANEINELS